MVTVEQPAGNTLADYYEYALRAFGPSSEATRFIKQMMAEVEHEHDHVVAVPSEVFTAMLARHHIANEVMVSFVRAAEAAPISCHDFIFTLGKVIGLSQRQEVRDWLRSKGMTEDELAAFVKVNHAIASRLY